MYPTNCLTAAAQQANILPGPREVNLHVPDDRNSPRTTPFTAPPHVLAESADRPSFVISHHPTSSDAPGPSSSSQSSWNSLQHHPRSMMPSNNVHRFYHLPALNPAPQYQGYFQHPLFPADFAAHQRPPAILHQRPPAIPHQQPSAIPLHRPPVTQPQRPQTIPHQPRFFQQQSPAPASSCLQAPAPENLPRLPQPIAPQHLSHEAPLRPEESPCNSTHLTNIPISPQSQFYGNRGHISAYLENLENKIMRRRGSVRQDREKSIINYLKALSREDKYDEVFIILTNFKFSRSNHSWLQTVWLRGHYNRESVRLNRPLNPSDRARVRKMFPFPSSITNHDDYDVQKFAKDFLKTYYTVVKYPKPGEKEMLSEQCQMTYHQVNSWFKNRRARDRDHPPEIPTYDPAEAEDTLDLLRDMLCELEEEDVTEDLELAMKMEEAERVNLMRPDDSAN